MPGTSLRAQSRPWLRAGTTRLAESAQVDAELAEAKAEARFMRRAADQILQKTGVPPTQAELESRTPRIPPVKTE
jgi:hypothetical protein